MKKLLRVCLLIVAPAAAAQPLTIVTVSTPEVQCVFSPKCKVAVEDLSSPMALSGFLQSRNYKATGGLYVYEYRVDLREAAGENGIATLTIDLGPTTKLDYAGNGARHDVFVTAKGNLGSVGLLSAVRSGNSVIFTFQRPVHTGDSSYFFGVASKFPRRSVTASVGGLAGVELRLDAWGPAHP